MEVVDVGAEACPLGEVDVEARAEVVRRKGVVDYVHHAVGVIVAAAHKIVQTVVAAAHGHVVLLLGACAAEEIAVPVEVAVVLVVAVFAHDHPGALGIFGLVVAACFDFGPVVLVVFEIVLVGVDVIEAVDGLSPVVARGYVVGRRGVLGPAEASVVTHGGALVLAAGLCCHQHHAGRCLGAVDGRRRGVFKHRHRLDVVWVHAVEGHLHTVDEDKGGAAVERGGATDVDAVARRGAAGVYAYVHCGVEALERLCRRRYRAAVDFLAVDYAHGAGDVDFLLRAEAYNHNLVERLGVLVHAYVEG